jgi:hypothetical protein
MSYEELLIKHKDNVNLHGIDCSLISIIILSTIFHFMFNMKFPLQLFKFDIKPNKTDYIQNIITRCLITSTFHASFVVLCIFGWLSIFNWGFNNPERMLGQGIIGTGDEYYKYVISFSVGYFIYDLVNMIINPCTCSSISSFIHHIAAIIILLAGLYTKIGVPFLFYFSVQELSTPFLNLKSLYNNNEKLSKYFSIMFVVSFVISRFLFYGYLCYKIILFAPIYIQLYLDLGQMINVYYICIQSILCICFNMLNNYWLHLLIKKYKTS